MAESRGFRIVDHTADVIVEAWGETEVECLEELARGFCSVFAGASAESQRRGFRVEASGADLAPTVLEEIIYLLDTSGSIPIGIELTRVDATGAEGRILLAPLDSTEITGPAPKAVARTDSALTLLDGRWRCRVTVDV
jgi:SHS2 domain-containing protein